MPQALKSKAKFKERDGSLDFLRGFAVLLMVFVHASAYFLSSKSIYSAWDYAHFVVPLFVFCSTYITFNHSVPGHFSLTTIFKRVKRLVIPYFLMFALPSIFLNFLLNDFNLDFSYAVNILTLGNSRDVGWLVVLFIYVILLNQFILFLRQRYFFMFKLLTVISVISTIYLLFNDIPVPFRYVMFLPWSAFLFFVYFFVNSKKNIRFYVQTILGGVSLFLISRFILVLNESSLVFTDNKYPPNLYYLSYGSFLITTLHFIYFKLRVIFDMKYIKVVFNFLSTYSYQIFFIHFLIIHVLTALKIHKLLGLLNFTLVLIFVPVLTIILFNYFFSMLKNVKLR